MPDQRPLGDYLRARRELVQPEDVGIAGSGARRRVAGLRRSEVAQLAGISAEYYVKLEQGRESHPTTQVLDALSRALQLDATARGYLHSLAHLQVAVPAAEPEHTRTRWLIDSWPTTAAMIHDPYCEAIAVNSLMSRLIPAYQVGRNSIEAMLIDPSLRELHGDEWNGLASRSVALLRITTVARADDVRFQQLLDRLTRISEQFREQWNRKDVHLATEGVHQVTHPTLGPLTLQFARLPLAGAQEYSIFTYYAEPGSPTAQALTEFAGWGA
ncbi:helix-turn-helix transcriptional regulator [soil metagenome]